MADRSVPKELFESSFICNVSYWILCSIIDNTVHALIFAGLNFRGFLKFAIFAFIFSRVPIQCHCFFLFKLTSERPE